jgi:hypothetical protein
MGNGCAIFISYRRSDAAGHAWALYRELCRRFDSGQIFFDRDSIEAGEIFPDRLRAGVTQCKILLALIGPDWLEVKDDDGRRRLEQPQDYVRQEIALALLLARKVIPVLLGDTTSMPEVERLPEPMQPLAQRDALHLRGKTYEYDTHIAELIRLLAETPGMPAPRPGDEDIAFGDRGQLEIYRGIRYQPVRLRAPLRDAFRPLIEDRTKVFGGRQAVVARIMQLIAGDKAGYVVITAPAGFGKTALIANLVGGTPEAFAYHFFTSLYGDRSLDEGFFLRNVVQQLAQWHGHSAELPDDLEQQQSLYQNLIDQRLDRTGILVLDGVDEVTRWKLEPYLSRRLPDHLRVIVTLRDVGQDWRTGFAFPADQVMHLPLDGLDRDGVADVLRGLGGAAREFAEEPSLLDKIVQRAAYEIDPRLGADPFYVRFLAEDIAARRLTRDSIENQPHGLEGYLNRWWKQLKELAGNVPVRDLFGTLAAALGPLLRSDLESMCPSLRHEWAGDYFDEVLTGVRRMVTGDPARGYALAHPRLRRYVADAKRIGKIEHYRKLLLGYCAGWREHGSRYALRYYAAHLVEARMLAPLSELFSGEWIAAHWNVWGSYSTLVDDLDRSVKAFALQDPPDYARIAAFAVARQTAREQMLDLPVELLEAWIALGRTESVLAVLSALGTVKGRAVKPMTAVAAELLARPPAAAPDGNRSAIVGDLLARAMDMVPFIRGGNFQYDALQAIAELLHAGRGLEEGARERLIDDALHCARSREDACIKAMSLGAVAEAVASAPEGRDRAQTILDEAQVILSTVVRYVPDRTMVLASLLRAIEDTGRAETASLVEAVLAETAGDFSNSSVGKDPINRLLYRWRPWLAADPDAAARVLQRAATSLVQARDYDFKGEALSRCARHLCRLGRVAEAQALVEEVWQTDPLEAAYLVVYATQSLHSVLPAKIREWLARAGEFTTRGKHNIAVNREMFTCSLATSFAEIGEWEEARRLLDSVTPSERIDGIIYCIRLEPPAEADAAARRALADSLVALAGPADARDQARVHAAVSKVLAAHEPEAAQRAAARATELCLAEFSEGGCDNLRKLLAVSRAGDGAASAVAEVRAMTWISSMAETLTFLISRAHAEPALDLYAGALLRELDARRHDPSFGDALEKTAELLPDLVRRQPGIAALMSAKIAEQCNDLPASASIHCRGLLAFATTRRAPDEGAAAFHTIAGVLHWNLGQGFNLRASDVAGLYQLLAQAAGELGPRTTPLLEAFDRLRQHYADPNDRGEIDSARCMVLAETDCGQMRSELRALISGVKALRDAPPRALFLSTMISNLMRRLVGPNERQANLADHAGKAAARGARRCRPQAVACFEALLDAVTGIESRADRTQALVDFVINIGAGPAQIERDLAGPLDRALDEAGGLGADAEARVLRAAVEALCRLGNPDEAMRRAQRAHDDGLRSDLQLTVTIAREREQLGALNDFDAFFIAQQDSELAVTNVHKLNIEKAGSKTLGALVDALADGRTPWERARLLDEFLPHLALFLRSTGGSNAIAGLAGAVEDLDRQFLDAARRIGAA